MHLAGRRWDGAIFQPFWCPNLTTEWNVVDAQMTIGNNNTTLEDLFPPMSGLCWTLGNIRALDSSTLKQIKTKPTSEKQLVVWRRRLVEFKRKLSLATFNISYHDTYKGEKPNEASRTRHFLANPIEAVSSVIEMIKFWDDWHNSGTICACLGTECKL